MEMNDYGKRVGEIDERIIDLFTTRMKLVSQMNEARSSGELPIEEIKRERETMDGIIRKTPDELRDYTSQLYDLILDMSKNCRNRMKPSQDTLTDRIQSVIAREPKAFPEYATVACQGTEGANSQFACERLFRKPTIMFFSSFDAVFSAVEKGLCQYGVIPIENSTAGSVNTVYDLMLEKNFTIVRSARIKIEHNLLARKGVRLEDIKEIYTHEQAVGQCSDFLNTLKGVRIIPCENTAVAAKLVAQSDRNDIAAIASATCIKYYDLQSLKDDIQNNDNNYTRFICISRDLEIYPGADRTSLMVTLGHEPGTLYKFLSKLYVRGINLLKLESRPLPNREYEFKFYFDIEASIYSSKFILLLEELRDSCEEFAYLGSYSEIF